MNLYIDAEWFPDQRIFLIGYARERGPVKQLYGRSLTRTNFINLLKPTTGYIFFYGPDIGMCEKFFGMEIRTKYKCVNLLRITRAEIPNASSWRLEHMEKVFHLPRHERKYKQNIFAIYGDWRSAPGKERVLKYNADDVANLVTLKKKMFDRLGIGKAYLNSILMK